MDLQNNSYMENTISLKEVPRYDLYTRLPTPKEWYTAPKETEIRSIPTVIVDPHNEVFSFWMKVENEPAWLLHIDKHEDDADEAPVFNETRNGPRWSPEQIIRAVDYARNLRIDKFICSAMHKEIVDRVYWWDPRQDDPRYRNLRLYDQSEIKPIVRDNHDGSPAFLKQGGKD